MLDGWWAAEKENEILKIMRAAKIRENFKGHLDLSLGPYEICKPYPASCVV